MNRVLIFTDAIRWKQMDDSLLDQVADDPTWKTEYPGQGGPQVAECIFRTGKAASLRRVSDCEREGVYLVYDFIDPESFERIKEQCGKDGELYVLYHGNTPSVQLGFDALSNCTSRMGHHENDEDEPYFIILGYLTDNNDDKLGRIVDKLRKLNRAEKLARLSDSFITLSVNPSTDWDALKRVYDELCAFSEVKDLVEAFYRIIDPERGPVAYSQYAAEHAQLLDDLEEVIKEMKG